MKTVSDIYKEIASTVDEVRLGYEPKQNGLNSLRLSKWLSEEGLIPADEFLTSSDVYIPYKETFEPRPDFPTKNTLIVKDFSDGEIRSFEFGNFKCSEEILSEASKLDENRIRELLNSNEISVFVGSINERITLFNKFIQMGVTWSDTDPFYIIPDSLIEEESGITNTLYVCNPGNFKYGRIEISNLLIEGDEDHYNNLKGENILIQNTIEMKLILMKMFEFGDIIAKQACDDLINRSEQLFNEGEGKLLFCPSKLRIKKLSSRHETYFKLEQFFRENE